MIRATIASALALLGVFVTPQAAWSQAAPPTPAPAFIVIPLEITVDRPAPEVWARVGKFCDIGEWLQIPRGCTITAGQDGEIGAVRSVANEVLVGRTTLSYTYAQQPRPDGPYNLYHGTIEARPLTASTSRLLYTLVYDNGMLADAAARQADRDRRVATFTRALSNMKILAEGGTLQVARSR